MYVKKCTVCNIKIDKDKSMKDRSRCKNCYNMNRKKDNNNKKEKKVVDSLNIFNNYKK